MTAGGGDDIGTPGRAHPLLRLHGLLTDIGYLGAAFALIGMGVLYAMEVVARYAFSAPTRWSLEVITFLMLIVTFLAIPHAVRSGMHIAVTLLADMYPRRARQLAFVMNGLGAMLCLFIAYISVTENVRHYTQSIETMGNLPIPKWWLTTFISYGFINSALWHLRLMLNGGEPIPPVLAIVPRPGESALS